MHEPPRRSTLEARRTPAAAGPLRIAFFVSRFPALSETFILHQITGLLELGHHVDIYARSAESSSKQHAEVSDFDLLARTRYLRHARRGWLGAVGERALWRALLPSPYASQVERKARWRASLALHAGARYDIVQAHFGSMGNLAAVLQKLGVLGGRLVTAFHGEDLRRGQREGGRIYAPLIEHDAITLAISSYSRDVLVRLGFDPERIVYHPVGIPVRRYANRWSGVDPLREAKLGIRVLTVARLVEAKGIAFALQAIRSLRDTRPDLKLEYRIAGEGQLEASLEREVAALGLADCVRFLGAANQDDVRAELAAAHVMLLPSVAEVLPVSLMEAQAAGLPVLATDVGAVREVVLDGVSGRIVPPGDACALARALAELLDAPARWPAFGAAGRAHVARRFDAEVLTPRLADLYRGLLSGARREPAR